MFVAMRMGLASRIVWPMGMPMGLIVNVSVCVLLRLMRMLMFVLFRHMYPHANGHKSASYSQLVRDALMQCDDGGYNPKEGCGGEIRGRARASQMAQRQYE